MKKTLLSLAVGTAAMSLPFLALAGDPRPPSIPVMDSWGLFGMSALLAILGIVQLLRRK